ncbi:MAG: hypothetical protein ABI681_03660 [Gemmatimonadales bacterium]
MAADLRRELGVDVQTESGHYGEFKVMVDGEQVASGGPLAFLGVMPSVGEVREIVASHARAESAATSDDPP